MQKIVLSVFAIAFTFAPTFIVPVEATYFSSVNDCHLHQKSEQSILINYFGTKIVSYDGSASYTKTDVHIPAGLYDVYLEGSDGYNGRAHTEQSGEKYAVGFRAHGTEVAVTNSSEDVPDGQDGAYWNGKVSSSLDITKDVDTLQIFHTGSTDSQNSVSPTCILLVPQGHPEPAPKTQVHPAAPICGNGTKENGEQCDDGNTISGDGCSAMCSPERQIVSPVCGNGIVEPGEQCDDTNKDELACTTQCKIPVDTPAPAPAPTPDPVVEQVQRCSSEIGNTVFNDHNNNGLQDEGEGGFDDVKVKLQYGDKVDTDKTNSRGKYGFDDLCEDTYRVIVAIETLPEGCFQTYDRDGKLDHTFKKELGENDDYTKADFGYHCPAKKVSPKTGPGSAAAAASAVFASAAAILGHRKLKKAAGTIITFD